MFPELLEHVGQGQVMLVNYFKVRVSETEWVNLFTDERNFIQLTKTLLRSMLVRDNDKVCNLIFQKKIEPMKAFNLNQLVIRGSSTT